MPEIYGLVNQGNWMDSMKEMAQLEMEGNTVAGSMDGSTSRKGLS
jgi:hypothetical protein